MSVLETVSGRTLYNQFLMVIEVDARPWILVEGDDECHVLEPHIDRRYFRTVPAHGKRNVLSALELFRTSDEPRVFFVVDRDFGPENHMEDPRLSRSTAYDLEAEILIDCPGVARQLLITHCRKEKFPPLSDAAADQMLTAGRWLAACLGAIRLASHDRNLGIKTSGFSFHEIVPLVGRGSSIAAIRRSAALRTKTVVGDMPSIREIREVALGDHRRVICGHDLVASLAAIVGRVRGRTVHRGDFRSAFHSAVSCAVLARVSLFEPARAWGMRVAGAPVWKCDADSLQGT